MILMSPSRESRGQTPAEESQSHTPIENRQEPGNDPYQTDQDDSPEVLENNETDEGIVVADLFIAQSFINGLDNSSMDPQSVVRLRNPYTEVLDTSDPNLRQSLDFYLATELASRDTYKISVAAVQRRNPEHELLSFHGIEQKIAELYLSLAICVVLPSLDPTQNTVVHHVSTTSPNLTRSSIYTIPLGPQS